VMLLGDVCTRGCRFCAVTTGDPRGAVDVREPEHVARAIARLGLQYVVLTMVNRDDLLDGGADHVARTVKRLHALRPDLLVETLVGDFQGHLSAVDVVAEGAPDVFAHNVETVRRLTRTVRDVRSQYDQSLRVLERAKAAFAKAAPAPGSPESVPAPGERPKRAITKSSIMVGLGETDVEVVETMRDLRSVGVDVVTIGQYLRPTPKHHDVLRFVPPETFDEYAREAKALGFLYCASGPLVRSSYRAAEVFLRSVLGESANSEERVRAAREAAARVAAELGEPEPRGRGPDASDVDLAARAERAQLLPATSLVGRTTR